MKRAIVALFLFFGVVTLLPGAAVYAQETPGKAICSSVKDKHDDCVKCFDEGGAWTAFNCIGKNGDPSSFVAWLLQFGTGIGGGIAFLLILVSGFQRITSAGNPEKLHEAKELMTAAISGLLLIIFSIFLLRIIGVDILQIPGWSR